MVYSDTGLGSDYRNALNWLDGAEAETSSPEAPASTPSASLTRQQLAPFSAGRSSTRAPSTDIPRSSVRQSVAATTTAVQPFGNSAVASSSKNWFPQIASITPAEKAALRQWQLTAEPGEAGARAEAVRRIEDAVANKKPFLSLGTPTPPATTPFPLTSIPPIPTFLANTLQCFELHGNRFSSLEGMPQSMPALTNLFFTENTNLDSLRGMPQSMPALQDLQLVHNSFRSLEGMPQELPALEALSVSNNGALTSLEGMPQSMPMLELLSLRDNHALRSPAGMEGLLRKPSLRIEIRECPISQDSIDAIYTGNDGAEVSIRNSRDFDAQHENEYENDGEGEAPASLHNEIMRWAPQCGLSPETLAAWQPLSAERDNFPLATLLKRLDGCAAFKPEYRAESMRDLREILTLAAHNDVFRAFCADTARGADADCHENPQMAFDDLRLAAKDPSLRSDATITEIVDYHKRCVPWFLINDFVSHHPKYKNLGDKLEKAMALRIYISNLPSRHGIDLPIRVKTMLYESFANLKSDEKSAALKYIKENFTKNKKKNLTTNLSRSPLWVERVERQYPDEFSDHMELWCTKLMDEVKNKPESDVALDAEYYSNFNGTYDEIVQAARDMPNFGSGREFNDLQKAAKTCLMKKLTQEIVDQIESPHRAGPSRRHQLANRLFRHNAS